MNKINECQNAIEIIESEAKRLREKKPEHLYREKAQVLEYAAKLVRNSIRLSAMAAPSQMILEYTNTWMSIETLPKSGEFLLAVWEGNWNNPKKRFLVYHASGNRNGPDWAMKGNYRLEEGVAYELAGWMPLPTAPAVSPPPP